MTPEELNILDLVLTMADNYFTDYCEITETYIYNQDEIDSMDDEIEQETAQENKQYNDLLNQAQKIIEKYKGGE